MVLPMGLVDAVRATGALLKHSSEQPRLPLGGTPSHGLTERVYPAVFLVRPCSRPANDAFWTVAWARDRIRRLGQAHPRACDWLLAPPSSALDLAAPSQSGCCDFGGWAHLPSSHQCPGCGRLAEVHGDHYLTCDLLQRYARQNTLRDAVEGSAETAGIGVRANVPVGNLVLGDLLLGFSVARLDSGGPAAARLNLSGGRRGGYRASTRRSRGRAEPHQM